VVLFLVCFFGNSIAQNDRSRETYDEEEFFGLENFQQVPPKKVAEPVAAAPKSQMPVPIQRTNWYLEIVYVTLIVAYAINYWIGSRRNEQIATNWASAVSKPFKMNFSKVGEGKNIGIVKQTQSEYILKATGRINCIGVQATLKLKKRHDLLSVVVDMFVNNEDTVVLDILMNDESMNSFVFALVKKKDEKKFRKNTDDVNLFTKGPSKLPEGFNESYSVFSECEELIDIFLNNEIEIVLAKYHNLFKQLHFSDQAFVSPNYKKTLQFVFKLPAKDSEMDGIQILTRLAFYYIDLVAKTQLSQSGQQKTLAHRSKALEKTKKEEHEKRQEAAQQRKLAKIQKENAEMDKMSPEEKQRALEKRQKRDLKRRMPKMKISG
jgi:hypothetical protein